LARGAYHLLQFEGVQRLGSRRLSLYRFRHVLFQTYLYEQMDPVERSRRHAVVGQALEALYSGQVEQIERNAARLARHFEAAGLADQAAAYWLQAGQRSLYLAGPADALASYRRGLALLADQPSSPEHDRLEIQINQGLAAALFSAVYWAGEGRGEALQRALERLWQAGDTHELPDLISLLAAQANWYTGRNELGRASQMIDQMLPLIGESGGLPLALACWSAGILYAFQMAVPTARQYLERALSAYEAAGRPPTLPLIGTDLGMMCQDWLAFMLAMAGCTDQAWELSSQAWRRLEIRGKNATLGNGLILASEVALLRGDQPALHALAEATLQLGQEFENPDYRAYGLVMQGEAELLACEPGMNQCTRAMTAARSIREGLQEIKKSGALVVERVWTVRLVEAYWKAGLIAAGLELVSTTLAGWDGDKQTGAAGAELCRLRGELLLAGPNPPRGEAETWLLRSLEASRRGGALWWELQAALSLARLWQAERPAEARSLLADVYGRFTEGWECPDLKAARALLAMLDQTDGILVGV